MSCFFVSSQYMKALNLEGITIFSAQSFPSLLSSTDRKKRATEYVQKVFPWSLSSFHCSTINTECGTDSCTAGDLLNMALYIKYPFKCLRSALCRKTFDTMVQRTVATERCKLILPISFTDGSIVDIQLTFCSFGNVHAGKGGMLYFVLSNEWYSGVFFVIL
jgi:hypothetical protein